MTPFLSRLLVMSTALTLAACSTPPQGPKPAQALEAHVAALRASVAQHTPISPAPLPRFETLVLARAPNPALASVWLLDQGEPIGPYAVLGERHPSGVKQWNLNKLFAPGVGVEMGEINHRSWHVSGYQTRDGTLQPDRIGSRTTLRVQDEKWGFDQTYEIRVVGRLTLVPGFEWLDDVLYVHALRHTFRSRERPATVVQGYVRLYSPKLGWYVYEGGPDLTDAPSWRAVGAVLNGQAIGLPVNTTQAQPMAAAMSFEQWVESPLRQALTAFDPPPQAAALRPSTTAPPQDTGVARSPGPAPSTSMPGSVSGGRVGPTAAPSAVGPLIAGSQMKLYPRVMTTASGHQIHGTAAGLACLKLTGRRDRGGNEEVLLTCAAALVDCQLRSDPSGVDHTRPCSAQYPTQIINSRPDVYHGEPRFLLRLQPSSVFVFGYNECAWNGSMVAPVPEGWAAVCGVDLAGLQREFDNSSPHKLEQLRKSRWGF